MIMPAKILIIDDEPDMLDMLELIITSKTPHTVVTTSDAHVLADLLEHDAFDLVITDLKMPALDGTEVIKQVQINNPGTPVIMITAFGTIEAAEEAYAKEPTIISPSHSAKNIYFWQSLEP